MRATGSRASRRAASAAIASIFGGVSIAVGLRHERRVIEAERMADQQARVELGRVEAGVAECCGKRRAQSDVPRAPLKRDRISCDRSPLARGRRQRITQRALGRQQLGLMLGDQRVDDLAQRLALDDLRQLVEREIDAVVGHAALREIVGADALGAVAGADLAAALGGARGVLLLPLGVVEPARAAPPSPWRGCGAASGPPAS